MGGNTSTCLPFHAEDFDALKQVTHYKIKEIEDIYEKFREEFPEGKITQEEFIAHYTQMFPSTNATLFAEKVFEAYDVDNNGVVSFKEFLCALSVSSRGSVPERLEWTFRMYDADDDGYIERDEAIDMLNAVFKLRGQTGTRELAEEEAHKIFVSLDKDMDDRLDMMEFIMGAKNSTMIMSMLGSQSNAKHKQNDGNGDDD